MKNLEIKFQKIYLPLLLVQLGLILIYSAFHWLILGFNLKDSFLNLILPFIISGLIVWFYFSKRFKLLKMKEKTLDFYSFFSWVILAIPVILSQIYLENKTADISKVRTVSEIDLKKTTELYSIQNAYADKENYRMWVERSLMGRHQDKILIKCYYICPLIDSLQQRDSKSNIWIGVSFSKSFSNAVFENEKEQNRAITNFISSTPDLYKNHHFQTNYLKNLIRDNDFSSYYISLKKQYPEQKKNEILILEELSDTAESKAADNLKWFFRTFIGGNLIWLIILIFYRIDKRELAKFNKKQKEPFSWEKFIQNYSWIKGLWVTSTLILLNLLVFLLMYFGDVNFNNSPELLVWGAASDKAMMNGEWWRLITSIFVHGGFIHLIYNLIILVFIGSMVEAILGSKRFLIFYFLCGLFASLISFIFKSNYIEVGASGAIFGLCGIYLGLALIRYVERNFLVVIILIFVLLNILFSFKNGISMSAHLGGLISGFILSILYFPLEKYIISKP